MYKVYIFMGLMVSILLGQNLEQKENTYLQLQAEKQSNQQKLDSLNQSLDHILTEIDVQKSKNENGNGVARLMSTAFTITKNIETMENYIKETNLNILKLEKELNAIYTQHMASLEKRLNENVSKSEREKLEQELGILAEKRIRVFPLFRNFSFNPAKINDIDLSHVHDNFEKEILLDYLKSALTQVDSNLGVIQQKEEELEDNKRLEEKADLFIGDVANSRIMGFYESSLAINAQTFSEDDHIRGGPIDNNKDWDYALENSISNTMNFLNQLEYLGMPPDELVSRFKISTKNPVTSDEYLEILKSSREFLTLYRNMLNKKISEK